MNSLSWHPNGGPNSSASGHLRCALTDEMVFGLWALCCRCDVMTQRWKVFWSGLQTEDWNSEAYLHGLTMLHSELFEMNSELVA